MGTRGQLISRTSGFAGFTSCSNAQSLSFSPGLGSLFSAGSGAGFRSKLPIMTGRRSGAGSLGGKHTFLQGAFFFRPRQAQLPRIYLKGILRKGGGLPMRMNAITVN